MLVHMCTASAPLCNLLPLLRLAPGPLAHAAVVLENDTETFEHERVSSELKKQIQSARLAKKLTQAQVGAGSSGSCGWLGGRAGSGAGPGQLRSAGCSLGVLHMKCSRHWAWCCCWPSASSPRNPGQLSYMLLQLAAAHDAPSCPLAVLLPATWRAAVPPEASSHVVVCVAGTVQAGTVQAIVLCMCRHSCTSTGLAVRCCHHHLPGGRLLLPLADMVNEQL